MDKSVNCCNCKDARTTEIIFWFLVLFTLLVAVILGIFSHFLRTRLTGIPFMRKNDDGTAIISSPDEEWGPAVSLCQRLGVIWMRRKQSVHLTQRPEGQSTGRTCATRTTRRFFSSSRPLLIPARTSRIRPWSQPTTGESESRFPRPSRPTSLPTGRRSFWMVYDKASTSSSGSREKTYDLSLKEEPASCSVGPNTASSSASSTRPDGTDETASKSADPSKWRLW